MTGEAIEFHPSRLRMAAYLLGSLLFVLGSVWILRSGDADLVTRLASWVGIPFFGLGIFLFTRETIHPQIRVRIDERGIESRHTLFASSYFLPWDEIQGVRLETIMGQPLVMLDVRDRDWGIRSPNVGTYGLRRANELVAGSGFALTPKIFGVKPEVLLDEIARRLRHLDALDQSPLDS